MITLCSLHFSHILLSGDCEISLVLSRHSKNLKWWTDQCYSSVLFRKQRKIHPWGLRVGQPKRQEEKRSPWLNFCSSFYIFFFLPLSLAYVDWASQEDCCFTWGSHSGPRTFLCSIFLGFSLLCLLATAIWTPFSYSNYLTLWSTL